MKMKERTHLTKGTVGLGFEFLIGGEFALFEDCLKFGECIEHRVELLLVNGGKLRFKVVQEW